ncbi:metallophosphoesterase [candidate division WOR-3 bacterium]|nr:metallophosphoesterase [candidate division WOR-3 bacterium]
MSRIGIISDTHDRLDKVRQAVALFNRLKPDRVVHCGDFVAQFVLREMGGLGVPVTAVYGNCDGDRAALKVRADELGFDLHDGPHRFEIGGRSIVISHKPLSPVPACDFYLHGHTHRPLHEGDRPVVVNPGEACGWLSGRATVAMLDTDTSDVEFFDL